MKVNYEINEVSSPLLHHYFYYFHSQINAKIEVKNISIDVKEREGAIVERGREKKRKEG